MALDTLAIVGECYWLGARALDKLAMAAGECYILAVKALDKRTKPVGECYCLVVMAPRTTVVGK